MALRIGLAACSLARRGPLALRSVAATSASRAFSKVVAPPESESHADFLPQPRKPAAAAASAAPPDASAIHARIDKLVRAHSVVLFMKGTPSAPQCGFSAQAVRLLNAAGADVHGVNILEDAALRAALKDYSKWPTFPQAYVLGEFVGGCDILTGMQQSGELAPLIAKTKKGGAAKA